MDADYQQRVLKALVNKQPVYVLDNDGNEIVVYSLEFQGQEAIGFRAVEGDRLIPIEEIKAVSLTSTRNTDAPFETLLTNAVDPAPEVAGEKAQVYKNGVLTIFPTPLQFGAQVPQGAFREIGSCQLAATIVAPFGYQIVFYQLTEEHAGLIPFPYYIYAADGECYWQIFVENNDDLRQFRDENMPGCEVEGLPPATIGGDVLTVEGNH